MYAVLNAAGDQLKQLPTLEDATIVAAWLPGSFLAQSGADVDGFLAEIMDVCVRARFEMASKGLTPESISSDFKSLKEQISE